MLQITSGVGVFPMKFRPDVLFPPGIVIEDERVVYRRRLQDNLDRQAMRDLEAEAYIENGFWGMPYKSIVEEYPWLAEELSKKGIR